MQIKCLLAGRGIHYTLNWRFVNFRTAALNQECEFNRMSMESNAQRKRQPDRPFYLPKGDTTSSRIITEAKESLNNRTGLQAVVTKRPSTPRDATRSLFGATSTRAPENRPPSSFRFVTLYINWFKLVVRFLMDEIYNMY